MCDEIEVELDPVIRLEYDAVKKYVFHLLPDYGIEIVRLRMTVGGDNYRGHILVEVKGDLEKVPEKIILELKEFALNSGGYKEYSMKGYTLDFSLVS
jgi:hypothetical protein